MSVRWCGVVLWVMMWNRRVVCGLVEWDVVVFGVNLASSMILLWYLVVVLCYGVAMGLLKA